VSCPVVNTSVISAASPAVAGSSATDANTIELSTWARRRQPQRARGGLRAVTVRSRAARAGGGADLQRSCVP
jgi:hypothetical protein